MPDDDKVWRIAAVASDSAGGSSYTVMAADGSREIEASSQVVISAFTRFLCTLPRYIQQ